MIYKKENNTSFALGAFAVRELLRNKPKTLRKIYTSRNLRVTEDIQEVLNYAQKSGICVEDGTKFIERIGGKENIYLMAEFFKFNDNFDNGDQIVLFNLSDMGNVGTILRTALAFGFKNVALIQPCIDIFNPRVVRASQGAIFGLNIRVYPDWNTYLTENSTIKKYLFMLDKSAQILSPDLILSEPIALVFGNEATGLPSNICHDGMPIFIKQSTEVDSLNVGVAVGIALHLFSRL